MPIPGHPERRDASPSLHRPPPRPRLANPFPDEFVDVLRPEEHLPVQRDLGGGDPFDFLEGVNLRGHVAEAIRPAEKVPPRRVRGLVNQDCVPDRATHLRKGGAPGHKEVVHELARVLEEAESRDDEDRLALLEAFEMPANRFLAQSRGGGEPLDWVPGRVDECVEDPPIQSGERAGPPRLRDPPPAGLAAQESRKGRDRARDLNGPDLDRNAAVHLPCDPGDVRPFESLRGVRATPLPAEVHEEVFAAEDRGVDRDPVSLNNAALLEAANPVADGRRGQPDPSTEGLQALPRVLVERGEEVEVLRVHGPPKAWWP